jgi:methionyl-tRNA formyltransferase
MRVVFFGTPEFSVPTLERLIQDDHFDVVAVVTQPDRKRGRGSTLVASPVKQVAESAGLPVWQPERIKKDADTLSGLAAAQADAFVVIAYGQILSPQILEMPRLGCINVHGSLLPAYRGAAPIQWAIHDGLSVTGNTTMLMDAGMDTGPMLLKQSTPIGLLDTAQDLAARLSQQGGDLLVETLLQLEAGQLTPQPQDDQLATYARLLQKEDFNINWQQSALAIHNQVRGFYPGCHCGFRGDCLKVLATLPLDPQLANQVPSELQAVLASASSLGGPELMQADAGTIVALFKGQGPLVQTADGQLLLREVQLPGRKAMSGDDFSNGLRVVPGEQLNPERG